ncbi:hypothetical protein ACM39_15580 [Chryseobacterium sp. FH2]|uniref:DUF6759 domain-containing protein n=1 Tax=Chryseobacterium sp. FH2 TaxID=1674291 RepID=UPI00065ADB44|nr:DUF6759 domain-containing protein [Chryseobacterium sp. FH2]KMQ67190.1 hypothetical protein ACM39_15580 [Chryseobacterium sp. FH2]
MRKKTITFLLLALVPSIVYAQKSAKNILKSTNIAEIEAYLNSTHPEDPKKIVLKPKLIALKNEAWTKGAKNSKPMEARPIVTDIPSSVMRNSGNAEEFKRLITENSTEHKDKTVKLLNAMFNEDISSKEAILLCKNNSDCNIIVRIQGKDFYNLAVPAHGENFIVVKKGDYILTSNVCDLLYSSKKEIKKGVLITLNNPVEKNRIP